MYHDQRLRKITTFFTRAFSINIFMIETVNQTLTWYCKLSLGYHSTKKISFFLDPIDEFRLRLLFFLVAEIGPCL